MIISTSLIKKALPYIIIVILGLSIYFGFVYFSNKIEKLSRENTQLQNQNAEVNNNLNTLKNLYNISLKQVEELQKQQQEKSKKQYDDNVEQEDSSQLSNKYKLINVIGVGNQLQATIEDIASGQNKRISVGKQLTGYTVKSISLNDGIVFEKDGVSENLNVGR